jgi:acyl carrier protein
VTRDELRAALERVLARIAPEAELGALDPRAELRETLDLDSMDFLNFVAGVHAETGIEVPEADYPQLATLEDCLGYLARKASPPRAERFRSAPPRCAEASVSESPLFSSAPISSQVPPSRSVGCPSGAGEARRGRAGAGSG